MPTITVDTLTFERLTIAASLYESSIAELVRSLVDDRISKASLTTDQHNPESAGDAAQALVPIGVFKTYKGHRVEGTFDPGTFAVRIQSSPWHGKEFPSPTAAAIAVVEYFSPDRAEPNTNGRRFWKLSDGGRNLETMTGRR